MSVAYSESSEKTTRETFGSGEVSPGFSKSPPDQETNTSETTRSSRPASQNTSTRKIAAKRTPKASEPLFSMDGFAVWDADELRQLMHESWRGFAVERGVQVAASLLQDDVVKLCGKKNSRDPDRENIRHGSQPGDVIFGGQKVAIRRP